MDRINAMSPENAAKERERVLHKASRRYMQPFEASVREFHASRNWTPDQVAELPDDWHFAEWAMYVLRNHYRIDSL
jgi:hypothetical protein